MSVHLAIFSLIFLKCGCKEWLVQPHSPREEREGVAAGRGQGWLPFSKGSGAGKFGSCAAQWHLLLSIEGVWGFFWMEQQSSGIS